MLAAIPRPGLPAVARRAKAGAIPQRRRHNHRRRSELSIPMAIAYRGTVIAGRFHSLAARAVSGLWIAILSVALTSTAALVRPEIAVQPDFARAADLGVSMDTLSNTLRIMIGGQEASRYKDGDEQFSVTLRLDDQFRQPALRLGRRAK